MSDNFLKVYNGMSLVPRSADPSNPVEGDVQFADGTARTKGLWEYKDGDWSEIGGSGGIGGGLDAYFSEDFSTTGASDFTVGNNSTFKGTDGSLGGDGTLDDNTVTPMNGTKSILYTSDSTTPANSLNDYYYSPVIPVTKLQRNFDNGVTLWVRSEIDAEVVMWDVTNGKKLNSVLDKTGVTGSNESRYSSSFFIPESCLEVQYGFHILTTPTAVSQELEFTNVELSTDPFRFAEIQNTTEWTPYTPSWSAGFGIVTNNVGMYRRVGDSMEVKFSCTTGTMAASIASVSLPSGLNIDSSKTLYNNTTASAGDIVGFTSHSQAGVNVQSNIISAPATDSNKLYFGFQISNSSDKMIPTNGSNITTSGSNFEGFSTVPIEGWSATSEHVITPAKSNANSFNALIDNNGSIASITTQGGKNSLDENAISSVTRNSTGNVTVTFTTDFFSEAPIVIGQGSQGSDVIVEVSNTTTSSVTIVTQNHNSASLQDSDFNLIIDRTGDDVRESSFLAAIPTPKIAYIKDVKSSGTDGGAFSSGSYLTRDLSDISGNTDFVSLSSNQFTLKPGKHDIYWSTPAANVGKHKSKLYDVTNSVDVELGSAEETTTGSVYMTDSEGFTTVEITEDTTYEIRHRCQNTSAFGFGRACSFGDDEIYSQVKIVKLR